MSTSWKDKCPECGRDVDEITNRKRISRGGSVTFHCGNCLESKNPVKFIKKHVDKDFALIGQKQL